MKFNLEKLQKIAKPLPDKEKQQMEHQIENRDWLLLSVKLAMKVRSLMASEGICQSELARRMGVSPAQITKILSGHENLGLKTIAKIESALGQSLFHIELDDNTHEVQMRERVEYIPFPVFIKSKPIEKSISSAFSAFDTISQIAYS